MPSSQSSVQGVAAAPTVQRLPARLKLAYGVGQFAEGVATNALNTFIFFFYTAVLGLSGTLAGAAMFLSLSIDAVADPLIGSVSDNLRTRWGRRLPMMAAGVLPLALTLALLFSPPRALSELALFAWLTVFAILHRIAHSMVFIPFTAMGAELSTDYAERSSIVIYRLTFGNLAGIATLVLGYVVFLGGPKGLLDTAAYVPLGWTFAALIIVSVVLCLRGTSTTGRDAAVPDVSTHAVFRRLPGEVAEIFRNPSFRILFAGLVLFYVALGAQVTLGLHANAFFWRLTTEQIRTIGLTFFVGLLGGMALMPWLSRRLEKRSIVIIGMLLLCLGMAGPASLKLLGLLTATGAALTGWLSANIVVIGVGATMAGVAFSSMMGDAADEHRWRFGTRREGLYFAGLGFAGKTAAGVGVLVAGIGIDVIGFPRSLAGNVIANIYVAPSALFKLGMVYGPGTAAIAFTSVLLLSGYRITRARHAEILRALN